MQPRHSRGMKAAGLKGFFVCLRLLCCFFSGDASIGKVQLSLNKTKSCTCGLPSITLTAGRLFFCLAADNQSSLETV